MALWTYHLLRQNRNGFAAILNWIADSISFLNKLTLNTSSTELALSHEIVPVFIEFITSGSGWIGQVKHAQFFKDGIA